jgi:hypothetical protein
VIQLVIRVGDRDARLFEIAHGANYICSGHVVPRIVVEENNKDTFVVTMGRKDDKVVQGFEVNGVPRQDSTLVTNGMGQVDLVALTGQADVGRGLNLVPVTAEQSDQLRIGAVIVDV